MYGILRHTATIATVRFDLCHTSGHHQADLCSNFDDIATVWQRCDVLCNFHLFSQYSEMTFQI